MPAFKLFSKRLKELRGKTSVKELAKRAALSHTTLYNAEAQMPVSWQTIELTYGRLCKTDEEYAELLLLWALTQTKRPVTLYRAKEALASVMEEISVSTSISGEQMLEQLRQMDGKSQEKFAAFAQLYRSSLPTRSMTEAWMESMRAIQPE